MAHLQTNKGATINGTHTLNDLGLIISNNNIVGFPEPKTKLIDVPGSSRQLDLTETLTGRVEYSGRTLTFEFGGEKDKDAWFSFMERVTTDFHGKQVQVILDIEPEYVYKGRAYISGFEQKGRVGTFKMIVEADAYKYDVASALNTWEWDTLNFEDGIIREYANITVSGTRNITLTGSEKPVVPLFTITNLSTSSAAYIMCAGVRFNLVSGTNRFANLIVPEAGASLIFYGNYTVSIEFEGGRL